MNQRRGQAPMAPQKTACRPRQAARRRTTAIMSENGGSSSPMLPARVRVHPASANAIVSATYATAYTTPAIAQFIRIRSNVCGIDLRALQPTAEIHVHRFPFRKDVERRGAGF